MMFWILIAVLTAGATLSVLVPLNRRLPADASQLNERGADAAVYRQQMDEVDKDLERGLIDDEAAEAARTEIARRMLAADERRTGSESASRGRMRARLVTLLALIVLPAGAVGLYIYLGTPGLPDRPLQARLAAPPESQSVEELIARVERHLADNPQDGQGWSVVAPVYMRVGNPSAAANAYANALRILGSSVKLETDFGEALTVANNGIVSADAHAAFERAVALDRNAVKPRFFLALALGQEGKTEEAITAWTSLLEGANPAEPWVPAAQAELSKLGGAQLAARLGDGGRTGDSDQANAGLPGPSAEDVAAAQGMNAQDRGAMIAGMVQGLAERLEADGGSVDEWLRLIRAYMVLNQKQEAVAALGKAREAFAQDADALGQINEIARRAGLEGS
ncbi:c-type cytochrome biogenesis protein CcmI [Roseibium sp.]|uniref:c-type cytochrome biogenesis protein CcmI n=1 Tax=Roseibium sp. TaxID=1936156 RepID=UPI003A97FA36